jgi:hypothetical protein
MNLLKGAVMLPQSNEAARIQQEFQRPEYEALMS